LLIRHLTKTTWRLEFLLRVVHLILILKHRGASETHHGSSSECEGVLLGTIGKDHHLLLLLLALLLVVSLLPQIIKHVLHIVLPLSGLLLIF